ncbi:MAG: hypothetical protein AAGF07_03765 [Patescibacteria group bacterium]
MERIVTGFAGFVTHKGSHYGTAYCKDGQEIEVKGVSEEKVNELIKGQDNKNSK